MLMPLPIGLFLGAFFGVLMAPGHAAVRYAAIRRPDRQEELLWSYEAAVSWRDTYPAIRPPAQPMRAMCRASNSSRNPIGTPPPTTLRRALREIQP